MNSAEAVKKIIESNTYITIATSDGERPWITPVFFAHDKEYNFYWSSFSEVKHSLLISKNPNIAAIIFDSSSPEGQGDGVYIQGTAHEVAEEEILHAIGCFEEKRKKIKSNYLREYNSESHYSGGAPWRIYKIVPDKIWKCADVILKNGYPIDSREEIQLSDLKRVS
jgi:nitroimidazol reductase NimA-like FMN-containing flavoprotein (pyridoxamine 5'-phosphate oxidase superfamily)